MKKLANKTTYKIGDTIQNCTIISVEFIKDIQAELIILKHAGTGARIMQVVAKDSNNLFNIFLPTYPTKSNGIAHILEHTTLCGSQKYPVRDSFFAMTKRSLNTFMNAMTGSDFTCYPASSMVEKDYFNLLEIYLDAVFYPSLRHMSFLQEGHRFEFDKIDNPKSALTYKGVVYNEMKGALSNPQSLYSEFINEKLFPSTIYGINSGGEPAVIPDLTYQELKDFHKKYYHPSNAIFFFYGDIPLEKNLSYINEKVLSKFKKSTQLAPLKKEVRYKKPIKIKGFYPVDTKNDNAYFSGISWLTCDCKDPVEVFGLDILVDMLTDYEHSPLKVALVNSGLGVDLVDFNIDSELNEIPVTFGVKGVHKKNILKVHQVIMETLRDLSVKGLDDDLVKSAFHAIEIQSRERREPYGLHVSFKSILPYQRGLDPTLYLQPDVILGKLSARIEKGGFFKELIKKWFLDNPHRVESVLIPDIQYSKKQEQAVLKKLAHLKSKLKDKQKAKIVEDALQLQAEQSKGDEIEKINLLPCLKLSDIKKKATQYPLNKKSIEGVPVYYFKTPTNGISYIKVLFDINDLSSSEKMVLPVLGNLLTTIGTTSKNFLELSKELNLYTGGVNIFPIASSHVKKPEEISCFMSIVGSCVYRNTEKLLSIISEIALTPSFANKNKVLETVLQLKTDLYEKINPGVALLL
jgi:Zn-dependent M16 (insulinase) family peptidase